MYIYFCIIIKAGLFSFIAFPTEYNYLSKLLDGKRIWRVEAARKKSSIILYVQEVETLFI